jgi:hypothetical protein
MNKHQLGLYFPYSRFRSDTWLKVALLYWENLAHIAFEASPPHESDTVRLLKAELNFIDDFTPQAELENVAASFIHLFQDFGQELVARYRVHESSPGLAEVFVGDLSPRLHVALLEGELALGSPETGGRLLMHPQLAKIYMTAMAKELAARHGLHPVTQDTPNILAMAGSSVKQIAQVLLADDSVMIGAESTGGDESDRQIAYLAIESVLPRKLSAVSLPALINFRRSYNRELAALRQVLAQFVEDAAKVAQLDATEACDALTDLFNKKLGPELAALRFNLTDWGIETVPGALCVQLPVEPWPQPRHATAQELRIVDAAQGALALADLTVRPHVSPDRSILITQASAPYVLAEKERLSPRLLATQVCRRAAVLALG